MVKKESDQMVSRLVDLGTVFTRLIQLYGHG